MQNLFQMLRKQPAQCKQKARRVKYRGIVADAEALNVSRIHLWFVLEGRRESELLLKRYRELKKVAV